TEDEQRRRAQLDTRVSGQLGLVDQPKEHQLLVGDILLETSNGLIHRISTLYLHDAVLTHAIGVRRRRPQNPARHEQDSRTNLPDTREHGSFSLPILAQERASFGYKNARGPCYAEMPDGFRIHSGALWPNLAYRSFPRLGSESTRSPPGRE